MRRPVTSGWNWINRQSASVLKETRSVVSPSTGTCSWARSCSCTAREKFHVVEGPVAPLAIGDVRQIKVLSGHSWLIKKNNILAPEASSVNRKSGHYSLAGYTSSSSALVFCSAKKPHCVFAKSQLRLWYGEDLFGDYEANNGGRTCADVYALIV